ncbi:hypothetical protein [Pseudemcibacter aquimaris]|nr:hypothetical protein [Pseudemcibacter aquimaris]
MEFVGILGFLFALIAMVRVDKLTRTLKEKGFLEEDYVEDE